MAETLDPRFGTAPKVVAGAVAGPETAAEHVRNAEQILDLLRNDLADLNIYKDAAAERGLEIVSQVDAARAQLARALAALEGPEGAGEPRRGAPRADADGHSFHGDRAGGEMPGE